MLLFGYHPDTNSWSEGLFFDSASVVDSEVSKFLLKEGVAQGTIDKIIQRGFEPPDTEVTPHLMKGLGDPHLVFRTLKQWGMKVAICTSDYRQTSQMTVGELELGDYMDCMICGDDPEALPKPEPHNVHQICKKTGVPESSTLLVGDGYRDIEMAKRAGVKTIVGVTSGVSTEEQLWKYGCHYVCDDTLGILDLLGTGRG